MKISPTTTLIHVDSGVYPVYMNRVRKDNPNVSFPPNPSVAQIAEFGYAVVQPTARPAGDVVTEGQPALVDGIYTQTWDVREYTAEEREVRLHELKEQIRLDVNAKRDEALAQGFDFETADTIIGVKLGSSDRLVLAQLQQQAERHITQGAPDTTMTFRSRDNETLQLTASVVSQLTAAALAHADAIYQASWTIKDAAQAADGLEQLPEVPERLVGSTVHG